jgi:hypothetical protein
MKRFELIKDTLGLKSGQVFIQQQDGEPYFNISKTCQLSPQLIETNTDFFKEIPADQYWNPVVGQNVFVVGIDGNINELPWDDKLSRLQAFGNVFETREQAQQVNDEFELVIRSFQEKFNSERPKEATNG